MLIIGLFDLSIIMRTRDDWNELPFLDTLIPIAVN